MIRCSHKSRSGHQREQRTAMLGGKADDLVRNAGNHGQQRNANAEPCPERLTGIAMYTNIEMIITVIRKLVPQRG